MTVTLLMLASVAQVLSLIEPRPLMVVPVMMLITMALLLATTAQVSPIVKPKAMILVPVMVQTLVTVTMLMLVTIAQAPRLIEPKPPMLAPRFAQVFAARRMCRPTQRQYRICPRRIQAPPAQVPPI